MEYTHEQLKLIMKTTILYSGNCSDIHNTLLNRYNINIGGDTCTNCYFVRQGVTDSGYNCKKYILVDYAKNWLKLHGKMQLEFEFN
jgi:hypothetical protein